jgi:hypothetical protein
VGNAALPAKLPGEDDAGNGSTTVFLLVVFVLSLLMVNPLAAGAADNSVSGTAYYDAAQCPTPRPGMRASPITTAWCSREASKAAGTPALRRPDSQRVYLETGGEVFVGSLDGGAVGTFATTYRFGSRDPVTYVYRGHIREE